jgi:hypothetical protein
MNDEGTADRGRTAQESTEKENDNAADAELTGELQQYLIYLEVPTR